MAELRAPYPYFGVKRRVAPVVWRAFGRDVPNFIDPFFGSNAILLARPGGPGKIETINDADRMVANFWRALCAEPWAVAEWADGPVNEADMHAHHRWLVAQLADGAAFREQMHADPDFFDVKIAGWWVNGICEWIGGGWCVEPDNHKHPKLDGIGKGVHAQHGHGRGKIRSEEENRPDLTGQGRGVHSKRGGGALRGRPRPNLNGGQGVHAPGANGKARNLNAAQRPRMSGDSAGEGVHVPPEKLPMLAVKADGACAGRGIHSDAAVESYSPGRRPELGFAGKGVHLPSLGNDRGIHGVSTAPGTFLHALRELTVPEAPPCFAWFAALALRLRRVRVACGDWKRVLGDSVLGKGKNVGGRRPCAVFLDPPYGHELRDPYLYSEDDPAVAAQVREWALEHGDDPDLRIALCGYQGENEMPASWTEFAWKGSRGYAAEGNTNRERERIWFSPHCLPLNAQRGLFDEVATA